MKFEETAMESMNRLATNDYGEDTEPDKPDGSAGDDKIFSGDNSQELWDEINSINAMSTGDDIHGALYSITCSMQKLEANLTVMPDNIDSLGDFLVWIKTIVKKNKEAPEPLYTLDQAMPLCVERLKDEGWTPPDNGEY